MKRILLWIFIPIALIGFLIFTMMILVWCYFGLNLGYGQRVRDMQTMLQEYSQAVKSNSKGIGINASKIETLESNFNTRPLHFSR